MWQPKEIWTSTKLWGTNDTSASTAAGAVGLATLPSGREVFQRLGALADPVRHPGDLGHRLRGRAWSIRCSRPPIMCRGWTS